MLQREPPGKKGNAGETHWHIEDADNRLDSLTPDGKLKEDEPKEQQHKARDRRWEGDMNMNEEQVDRQTETEHASDADGNEDPGT